MKNELQLDCLINSPPTGARSVRIDYLSTPIHIRLLDTAALLGRFSMIPNGSRGANTNHCLYE